MGSHLPTFVVAVTVLLYFAVGTWLLAKGWPLRASLAMIVISFLPLTWQIVFTDSEAPGFGLVLVLMLPIPLLLAAVALVVSTFRCFGSSSNQTGRPG